ncbi:alpha/beta fold hydrolase [Vibrio astriarenae]|uniref:Alpha/beta fold hydrolase n=1 Tax=Vibrio astriarenae TaxID=1481923 RepID=A0A7Z2T0T4_9VIBR|nr:alpha/beta fold hydrolase [Vibrio astriarenae]QIA62172.1 alpha/beta fold hydrolase [Vibrio astriarenae]
MPQLSPYSLSQESEFEQSICGNIFKVWQQRQEGEFSTTDGKRIAWCKLTNSQHTKAIVVVNGRVESYWKYQELFFDLYNQGFDVYSFDHRGQGLSERLTSNKDIGYVDKFDDYVHDLACLIDHFSLEDYQSRYLLAHSMGGAITTRYLQEYQPQQFKAVALTAPMMGIEMPSYLAPIAKPLIYLMSKLAREPQYAPGHKAYYAKPFADNPLTQSAGRYHWFRDLYEEMPQLKLGGPSTHWVWQSLDAIQDIYADAEDISLPLLMLQASEDKIVSNSAQIRFMRRLARTRKDCALKIVYRARHELLFEQDSYRQETLDTIFTFFENHSTS